jgi:hypothetical protein
MSQTSEHLEHVEHVQHLALDPFDRRVAMTMAIVAAVLAAVTLLSHRAHNATLLLQQEANILHTQVSDQWGYYQAKKNRQYLYEATASMLQISAKDPTNANARERATVLTKDWEGKAARYQNETAKIDDGAKQLGEEAKGREADSKAAHHRADRFDLGELGVELALVLCSVAVLTKRKEFWLTGIGIGTVGVVVAATGLLMH